MNGVGRRAMIGGGIAIAMLGMTPVRAVAQDGGLDGDQDGGMFGLIGRMRAVPGKRDELAAILLEGTGGMPGCLSYIVAEDVADADALWITEVWDSADSHRASLDLPDVRDAITRGRPLIADFEKGVETVPLGGIGIGLD